MSQSPKLTELRDSKRQIERLNSFEFRENLLNLTHARHTHDQRLLYDPDCANPNWTALAAHEAFIALGSFAMRECAADRNYESGLGGIPRKHGIAARFYKYLQSNKDYPGIALLTEIYKNCVHRFCADTEELIFELTDGVAGNHKPFPARMLRHCEKIVRAFLIQELCGGNPPVTGNIDLFAVEGDTTGMSYIANSLITNKLLRQGDRIAIAVPLLETYFETAQFEKFGFEITYIHASGADPDGNPDYQYPESELSKLADPSIKAFFIMDPANPASAAMEPGKREFLVDTVRRHNPNLIIITDNTYGSFAAGFRSLIADLPRNTIAAYSFSKYFGYAGWRIGTVAVCDDNIMDELIASLAESDKEQLRRRYANITDSPDSLKFIDRMATDSRESALPGMAGLSAPQQIQMAIMSGFALADHLKGDAYRRDCTALLQHRYDLFWEGMETVPPRDPNRINYYCAFDIEKWAVEKYGADFFGWLEINFTPQDIVYRIAEEYAVAMHGSETYGWPKWSLRLSLASLDTYEYKKLGTMLLDVLGDYAEAWKSDSPPPESLT